jgi:hypothetical protein
MDISKLMNYKESKGLFNKLCKPSQLYFIMSAVAIMAIIIQNIYEPNENIFCLGIHKCNTSYMKWLLFIPQIIYILVWTIILNSLCKTGYTELSWLIVLFPFILFFIIMGIFMLSSIRI